MHRGMSGGAFTRLSALAVIGAVCVLLALSIAASARASLPPGGGSGDSCTVGTITVLDEYPTPTGDIGLQISISCNDSTATINGSAWLQRYIPLNNGWQNVGAWGATDHDGTQTIIGMVPCYPPVPSGSLRTYRPMGYFDVTFTDGIHKTYNPVGNSRAIACEAVM